MNLSAAASVPWGKSPVPCCRHTLPGLLLLLLLAGPWAAYGLDMGRVGGLAARRAGTASSGAPLRQPALHFGGLRLRGGQDEVAWGTQGGAEGENRETDGQYAGAHGGPDGIPEQAGAHGVQTEAGARSEHSGEQQHADAAPEQVPAGGADGGEGGDAGGTDGGQGIHAGDHAPPTSQHQSDVGTSNEDAVPSQEEGQRVPEPPPLPTPPPPSPSLPPQSAAGAGSAADPASSHLGPIIEYVVGKAIWSLVGFAAGWLVASYGVTYHRISALDDTDEEEEFVNAVLSLNLP